MYHLQQGIEETECRIVRCLIDTCTVSRLDEFEIPCAEIIPEQSVYAHQSIRKTEFSVMVFHFGYGFIEPVAEPFHSHGSRRRLSGLSVHLPSRNKAEGIPYLVAEIPSLLHLGFVEKYVIPGRRTQQHPETYPVSTVFGDKVKRIRGIAESLGHLPPELVPDYSSQIYIMERYVFHELVSCHDHPCHPEKQYIRSRHKVVGRVIIREIPVRSMLRMPRHFRIEDGYRPEP